MADDRNWRSYESNDDDRYSNRHNSDRSYRRSRDDRSSRSSPEDDRYEDESRSYRRSRSRSGSPEERRRRRARRREERESRNDSDSNDRRYEDGTYGYNSRRGAYESESRSNKRDEESHYSGNERITGHDWRSKLTSIRDAHFNRSKKAPVMAQNQFKNDGSFLEMFKKQMADKSTTSVTPNSLVLASSSIPYSPDLSLPPLTATPIGLEEPHTSSSTDQDLDGVPMPTHKSLPVPVSVR